MSGTQPKHTVRYLSDEWVAAADALLDTTRIDPPVPGEGFTIETVVTDAPDGASGSFVLDFSGGHVVARRRRADEQASVRFTQTYAVASAVAHGEMSAQAAFLAADIQVGGDVSTLIGNAGLIALVGDALGPLRAETTFDA